MIQSTTPAIAGGNEVLSLLQLLSNQPPSPLRDHLIQEAAKQLLRSASKSVDAETQSSTLDEELDKAVGSLPPFVRLPKPGQRCPHTGLSRTGLTELIAPCERNGNKPPISAVYKRSHARAQRGVWHIPTRELFRNLLTQRSGSVDSYAAMRLIRKENASTG